jgi:hypothetical protein
VLLRQRVNVFLLLLLLLSLAPQPSLGLGLLHKIRLNFVESSQQFSFLQGRVDSLTPNPHPGGPGLRGKFLITSYIIVASVNGVYEIPHRVMAD